MADRLDSDLDIHSDIRHPTTTVTASANASAGVYYSVDTTSGSVTMTLPALATADDGANFYFYKPAAANSMIIDGNAAETIEGNANVTRTAQYAFVHIRKNGSAWSLIKSAQPDGDLVSTNNLSDVSSAATSRGNLGIEQTLHINDLDLVAANAAQWRYVHPTGSPDATITAISTVLSGALATGDATITASIDGVAVTNGVVTITQSGSAEDDVDTAAPSANNVMSAGDVLTLTVGGTNTASETAGVSIRYTY